MSSLASFFENRNHNTTQQTQQHSKLMKLFDEKKQVPVVVEKKKKNKPMKKSQEKQKSMIEQQMKQKVSEQPQNLDSTVFVGNVALTTTKKNMTNFFKTYGSVEKVWFRSIPVEDSKLPRRAKVILSKYQEGADSMNAYIKYNSEEQAKRACSANGCVFEGKNIKVTMCNDDNVDYDCTIFIGNLPLKIKDQDLWDAFNYIGTIQNVRVIRNKYTMEGIGIAYIRFENKDQMRRAIAEMNGKQIEGRKMRIKKAVPKQKLEKKAKKIEAKKKAKQNGQWKNNKKFTQKQKIMKKGSVQMKKEQSIIREHQKKSHPNAADSRIQKTNKINKTKQIHKQIKKVPANIANKDEIRIKGANEMKKKIMFD